MPGKQRLNGGQLFFGKWSARPPQASVAAPLVKHAIGAISLFYE
jgi:hypothetical protein